MRSTVHIIDVHDLPCVLLYTSLMCTPIHCIFISVARLIDVDKFVNILKAETCMAMHIISITGQVLPSVVMKTLKMFAFLLS